ncbi:hypothetical protein Slin15195_G031000 [Septoria linicola]|uniref:Uncharacterized protein n=1 Tax=Septoria linicola TaxID=215465 RepID=A0A9Q9AS76_9PEZI|nr:hypothetical protein Slin14017_G030020 [Septoria linicola]USW49781.1 hypothetical protein Slin15195_G031000 [Septoria linicola]
MFDPRVDDFEMAPWTSYDAASALTGTRARAAAEEVAQRISEETQQYLGQPHQSYYDSANRNRPTSRGEAFRAFSGTARRRDREYNNHGLPEHRSADRDYRQADQHVQPAGPPVVPRSTSPWRTIPSAQTPSLYRRRGVALEADTRSSRSTQYAMEGPTSLFQPQPSPHPHYGFFGNFRYMASQPEPSIQTEPELGPFSPPLRMPEVQSGMNMPDQTRHIVRYTDPYSIDQEHLADIVILDLPVLYGQDPHNLEYRFYSQFLSRAFSYWGPVRAELDSHTIWCALV